MSKAHVVKRERLRFTLVSCEIVEVSIASNKANAFYMYVPVLRCAVAVRVCFR